MVRSFHFHSWLCFLIFLITSTCLNIRWFPFLLQVTKYLEDEDLSGEFWGRVVEDMENENLGNDNGGIGDDGDE